jgi:hypothetical protein
MYICKRIIQNRLNHEANTENKNVVYYTADVVGSGLCADYFGIGYVPSGMLFEGLR